MAPYLPRDGPSGSQYSEGGALYALGLITANHGHDIREFLLTSLRNASGGAGGSKPIIQHGACLGLGEQYNKLLVVSARSVVALGSCGCTSEDAYHAWQQTSPVKGVCVCRDIPLIAMHRWPISSGQSP